MSDGLFGLVGAVLGALVAGGAAYWGPVRLHRRQADLATSQQASAQAHADAVEARAREHANEMEARARRHEEELARRSDERASSADALARLAAMRTAPREWHELLRRTVAELEAGRLVDSESFMADVHAARRGLWAAVDAGILDGLWIEQSNYHHGWATPGRSTLRSPDGRPVNATDPLEQATTVVQGLVMAGCTPPPSSLSRAHGALQDVVTARNDLSEYIITKMAALSARSRSV